MLRLLAPLLDAVRWGEPWAFEDDDDELLAACVITGPPAAGGDDR